MKTYEKINEIKTKIGKITKDVSNDFANFKYTELSTIFEKINHLLLEYKLTIDIISVIPNIEMSTLFKKPWLDFKIKISTENENEDRIFTFPCDEEGKKMKLIQAAGSTYTYAQRYIYGVIFSIQFEIDPDSDKTEKEKEKEWMTENQFKKAIERIVSGEKDVLKNCLSSLKIKKEYYNKLSESEKLYTN